MKRLTIIIPFLLEKEEVEQTLANMYQYLEDEIDVILINDASDGGYDYKSVADKYRALYVENEERIGVAASRDKGIELCQTPYFLLLDAHMRFYNQTWLNRIIEELEKDSRTLLCTQTYFLSRQDGKLVDPQNASNTLGACIMYDAGEELISASWQHDVPFDITLQKTIPIVCVLGAAYACSKTYWQYLKGLNGLRYWGSDEPYISMKVWMEGGTCKLLKDVVIGHIYRKKSPYPLPLTYRLYNQVLIADLFFPIDLKKELWAEARAGYAESFPESLLVSHKYRDEILKLKEYYTSIFTRDFSFFEDMNQSYKYFNKTKENNTELLHKIFSLLTSKEMPFDIGLLQGRMGIVLFLFHYGRTFQFQKSVEHAEIMLDEIVESIQLDIHYGLKTGIAGIGWGIQHLYQEGFIELDINVVLEDFDRRVMELNPPKMLNLNREYGLGGIIIYVLSRLYTIETENLDNPFDPTFLNDIYLRVQSLINNEDIMYDCMDSVFDFVDYYDNKKPLEKPSVFDVLSLSFDKEKKLEDLPLGLDGISGIGLKLLLSKVNN